jgi:hypothetical protein
MQNIPEHSGYTTEHHMTLDKAAPQRSETAIKRTLRHGDGLRTVARRR